ncbi:MAG: hypothetical protein D6698_04960 [Gammaproteobacteria bacterium]|nr:MAG: hypothetical protein D6698_04960 [Gammaproteobacteria bacterium]
MKELIEQVGEIVLMKKVPYEGYETLYRTSSYDELIRRYIQTAGSGTHPDDLLLVLELDPQKSDLYAYAVKAYRKWQHHP